MMSSEISTDARPASTLRPWHFFLLTAILAATVGVVLGRGQAPSRIVFGSIAIFAASLIGIGVHRALSPLVSADSAETSDMLGGRTRAALEREKMLVLRSIKELEFDRAMAKISSADFDEMAARLRARAYGLIRQLDEGSAGYRDLIEKELAARLGHTPREAPPIAPHAVEQPHQVEQPRPVVTPSAAPPAPAMAQAVQALKCGGCGMLNDFDARFCKGCGQRLS